jgi:malonyl-CoA/methylmalonyl-CoA synthetase
MINSTLPLIERASNHRDRIAIIDENGQYTYQELLYASNSVASSLLQKQTDLKGARIAFMVPSGFEYVAVQWGIWLAGGIAVPLCTFHPLPEIEYVLEDTGVEIVVVHPDFEEKLQPLSSKRNFRFLSTEKVINREKHSLPQIDSQRAAMILYTSGTTSKPKGAVLTHQNITSQIETLIEAWGWSADDHILHVLPLHHTHGIVNALLCALWSGATCEMLPKFEARRVWDKFVEGNITLFMAVPTVYVRLISYWEEALPEEQQKMSEACSKLRLMVSGSAALPVGIFEKWKRISGHTLLERYGMTEIGMALSNPLNRERRPGSVGTPLPGVTLRLVDDSGKEINKENVSGEIQVKGDNVFKEYWNKPEATQAVFKDGWFCTGDVAVIENGYYKILGRSSVDIIKTGGYKVSALEIEEILRTHPNIKECAVVGIADQEWGEIVSAAIIPNRDKSVSLNDLKEWASEKMASYKMPRKLLILEELPRNAMGKVNKPALKTRFSMK